VIAVEGSIRAVVTAPVANLGIAISEFVAAVTSAASTPSTSARRKATDRVRSR
jgi:hypothetical protein